MRTLHQPNYNNRRKYSENDLKEIRRMQDEEAVSTDEYNAEMERRAKIVVSGLVGKYGFSEEGAKQTLSLIRKINYMGETGVAKAQFGSEEKRQAALRAAEYYWK